MAQVSGSTNGHIMLCLSDLYTINYIIILADWNLSNTAWPKSYIHTTMHTMGLKLHLVGSCAVQDFFSKTKELKKKKNQELQVKGKREKGPSFTDMQIC